MTDIPRIKHLPTDDEINRLIRSNVIAKMGPPAWMIYSYLCTKQYFNEPITMPEMIKQTGMDQGSIEAACHKLKRMGYAE